MKLALELLSRSVEASLAANVESAAEVQVATAVEGRVEEGIDEIIEMIEVDEDRIQKDQWLVMASPEVFEQLADEGYLFETVSELPGMGLRLAEVAAPSSFNISSVRQGVIDIVGSDRAEVDLNHIYTAGIQAGESAGEGILPRTAVDFPADTEADAPAHRHDRQPGGYGPSDPAQRQYPHPLIWLLKGPYRPPSTARRLRPSWLAMVAATWV